MVKVTVCLKAQISESLIFLDFPSSSGKFHCVGPSPSCAHALSCGLGSREGLITHLLPKMQCVGVFVPMTESSLPQGGVRSGIAFGYALWYQFIKTYLFLILCSFSCRCSHSLAVVISIK